MSRNLNTQRTNTWGQAPIVPCPDWNGDWPVANVSFPAGSAVRVNLAGRRDRLALANEGTLLLAWGEALDDVTFTLDDDTARRGFIIRAEETGLRFFYAGGTAIIVR